jgi:hypothetical protein
MQMQFRDTTKMAIQAAISIAIAEFISLYFNFERGYWIALTAMALTTQTWGESLKRSLERIGMTILGGGVGTALYFVLPENSTVYVMVLLLFVFFAVYMAKSNHLIFVFFLTCFLVFLFALGGDWNLILLRLRIIDTILGAIIAIVVGFFFFPLKRDVNQLLVTYFQKMQIILEGVFNNPLPKRARLASDYLSVDLQKLKKEALGIRLELLFHRLNAANFNRLLNFMENATKYMGTLVTTYRLLFKNLTPAELEMVNAAFSVSRDNINAIVRHLNRDVHKITCSPIKVADLIVKAVEENPQHFAKLEGNALGFYSLMYFFSKLNDDLNSIDSLLHGHQVKAL